MLKSRSGNEKVDIDASNDDWLLRERLWTRSCKIWSRKLRRNQSVMTYPLETEDAAQQRLVYQGEREHEEKEGRRHRRRRTLRELNCHFPSQLESRTHLADLVSFLFVKHSNSCLRHSRDHEIETSSILFVVSLVECKHASRRGTLL